MASLKKKVPGFYQQLFAGDARDFHGINVNERQI